MKGKGRTQRVYEDDPDVDWAIGFREVERCRHGDDGESFGLVVSSDESLISVGFSCLELRMFMLSLLVYSMRGVLEPFYMSFNPTPIS